MNTSKLNASNQVQRLQSLIAGIKKYLSKVPTLSLAGKDYTPSQVVDILQARIDAIQNANLARGGWLDAVKKNDDAQTGSKDLLVALHQTLMAMFGTQPEILNALGILPRKRTAPTAQTQAIAVVKNKATRAARLTVGSRKRLTIKAAPIEPPPQGGSSGSTTKG